MIQSFSMNSLVSGLNAWSELQQRGAQGTAAPASPAQDFGSVLQGLASSAVDTLRQGEQAAAAGIAGSLPLQQVVEQVLAAERTLQASIAVRDKVVGAYQEISRLQI
jgi:flagellar hook-basal body complex protein FliE